MEVLGSDHQVQPKRDNHLPGRRTAAGMALVVALSVIALHVAASPSSAEQATAGYIPQPVRLPSPLPVGSLRTIVLPARSDWHADQPVRAVALPRPLVDAPHTTEPRVAPDDPSGGDSPWMAAIVAALALLVSALARCATPRPKRPGL